MTVKDATPSNARTKALAERMFHRIQDYHKRRAHGHDDEEETEVKAALGPLGNETKKKTVEHQKGEGLTGLKGLEVFWAFFFGVGGGGWGENSGELLKG